MILGDWNTRSGKRKEGKVDEKYSLRSSNERRYRLIKLFMKKGLMLGNTLHESHKRRTCTRVDGAKYQIHYTIMQQDLGTAWKIIKLTLSRYKCRSHRTGCKSKSIKLKKITKGKESSYYNVEKLRNRETAELTEREMVERLRSSDEPSRGRWQMNTNKE